jgi:hypothetical protein
MGRVCSTSGLMETLFSILLGNTGVNGLGELKVYSKIILKYSFKYADKIWGDFI